MKLSDVLKVMAIFSMTVFAGSPSQAGNLTVDKLNVNSNADISATVQIFSRDLTTPVLALRQSNAVGLGFDFRLDTACNGNLYLCSISNTVANNVMSFSRNSGNVSIGTTDTVERLTVNGNTIVTSNLTVNGTIFGSGVYLAPQGDLLMGSFTNQSGQ